VDGDLGRVHPHFERIAVADTRDRFCDHLQQAGVLEVALLRLGVRVVHPAAVLVTLEEHPAAREREGLGRVQVCPGHALEGELRRAHFEAARADVHVERAVEVPGQVQPARLEERALAVERAVGVFFGGAGGHAVAARHDPGHGGPFGGHAESIARSGAGG
jgi:hypothetical protein